jgi:hypothetical protein
MWGSNPRGVNVIKFLCVGEDGFGGKEYINLALVSYINIKLFDEPNDFKALVLLETDTGSYKFRLKLDQYNEFLTTFEPLVIM